MEQREKQLEEKVEQQRWCSWCNSYKRCLEQKEKVEVVAGQVKQTEVTWLNSLLEAQ